MPSTWRRRRQASRRRSRSLLPVTSSARRRSSAGRRRRSSSIVPRRQRRRSRRRSPSTESRAKTSPPLGADRAVDRSRTPRRSTNRRGGDGGTARCSSRIPVPSWSRPTPGLREGAGSRATTPRRPVVAEQALNLAADLGLPEPAQALGVRGMARSCLGDRQGLEDMRRALVLAVEQGEGRAGRRPARDNLALGIWFYDGPRAALDACREGSDSASGAGSPKWCSGSQG